MNGIEKITSRINSDAQAKIDRINAEAAAQCEQIAKDSEKAAQDEYWKVVKQGANDAELRISRLGSVAALEAKKQVLGEKQAMIARAFDLAVQKLADLPESDYVAFLARQAKNASRTGSEQIILSPSDRARVGAAVCSEANKLLAAAGRKAALTLSDSTREMRGGLILSDGKIEMNCTLDVLVGMHRDELAAPVADILFGE